MDFQTCGCVATNSPLLLFTQYETCHIVISSHCHAKRRNRSKEVEQVKELGLPDGRYFTGLAGILLLI